MHREKLRPFIPYGMVLGGEAELLAHQRGPFSPSLNAEATPSMAHWFPAPCALTNFAWGLGILLSQVPSGLEGPHARTLTAPLASCHTDIGADEPGCEAHRT